MEYHGAGTHIYVNPLNLYEKLLKHRVLVIDAFLRYQIICELQNMLENTNKELKKGRVRPLDPPLQMVNLFGGNYYFGQKHYNFQRKFIYFYAVFCIVQH